MAEPTQQDYQAAAAVIANADRLLLQEVAAQVKTAKECVEQVVAGVTGIMARYPVLGSPTADRQNLELALQQLRTFNTQLSFMNTNIGGLAALAQAAAEEQPVPAAPTAGA